MTISITMALFTNADLARDSGILLAFPKTMYIHPPKYNQKSNKQHRRIQFSYSKVMTR